MGAKISGLDDVNVTLTGAAAGSTTTASNDNTFANIRALEQVTSGSVTAAAATFANTEGLAKFLAAGLVANSDSHGGLQA